MATAIDVLQPFIDTLTCPVCYLVLDKPRLLPCGHTFCLSCIQELYVQTRSDGDSDYSDDDDYENVAAFPVSCPVCRQSFSSPVKALPVNFVVKDVTAQLYRSGDGFCQICCQNRNLELATVRCRDCLENLCDSCNTQHADGQHICESLAEHTCCDKHHQKLELYCVTCRSNICVVCFSETHQSHRCEAISKMAERLIATLKNDAEALCSRRSRLETVLADIMSKKEKYENNLEECVNIRATEQRPRTAEETFKLVNKQRKVHHLIKKKLKASNKIVRRQIAGAAINGDKVVGLIQDISVILGIVILKLSSHSGRLQKVLSDMDRLQTTADDVIRSGSSSAHEATNKALTIARLGTDISVLLQDSTLHPYLASSCGGDATVSILSGEGLDDLEPLLKQASALIYRLRHPSSLLLHSRRLQRRAASRVKYNSYVVALYDYQPETSGEITLHVGDIITNLDDNMEIDWMCGTAPDGTRGLFPAEFVTTAFNMLPDAWD